MFQDSLAIRVALSLPIALAPVSCSRILVGREEVRDLFSQREANPKEKGKKNEKKGGKYEINA